jgi:Mlc titration factor MtfA (ptsG expression regulator)
MFGLGSWLRRRALSRAAIDEAAWRDALARCRVASHLDLAATGRLRELVTLFLDRKQFTAAGGLELDDAMRLAIALQACVPVLELGIDSYAPWLEVIVYPDEFIVEREHVDDAGVVHEVREPLSGESWAGGPVVLSWADVEAANPDEPFNVVLHEVAHKLDMLDGAADGIPPLHAGMSRAAWHGAFSEAYDDFVDRVEQLERLEHRSTRSRRRLPVSDTLEFSSLDRRWAALPLDPYAGQDAAEFFACASEAFFEAPARLGAAYPAVYEQLAGFFRQDPLGASRSASIFLPARR